MASPVELSGAGDGVWLMKVPKFLMHTWTNAAQGAPLGTLTPAPTPADTRPGVAKAYTLTLAPDGGYPPNTPKQLSVSVGDPAGSMYVLSRGEGKAEGKAEGFALEGKVEMKGDVVASALTAEYKALVKERKEKGAMRVEIVPIEGEGVRHVEHGALKRKKTSSADASDARAQMLEAKKARAEAAREVSDDELRTLIFEKFAEQKAWLRKDLMDETGQPQARLAKILDEVCDRGVGKLKGQYVLKREFVTH